MHEFVGPVIALLLFLVTVAWALVLSQKLPLFHVPRARVVRPAPVVEPSLADLDEDGLADRLEDELLDRFSPNALLSPEDPSRPSSIEWLRARQELAIDGPRIFGTVVPKRRFDAETRRGSPDPSDWKVYGHAYPLADGGVALQYWFYFPYNDGPLMFDHESDWEHVTIELDASRRPKFLALSRHDHNAPGLRIPWSDVRRDGEHPWFLIAGGTHAAYLDADEAPFWEKVADCKVRPDGRLASEACSAIAWRSSFDGTRGSPLVNVGEIDAPRLETDADAFFMRYSGLWGEAAMVNLGSAAPTGPPYQRGFCVDAQPGSCR